MCAARPSFPRGIARPSANHCKTLSWLGWPRGNFILEHPWRRQYVQMASRGSPALVTLMVPMWSPVWSASLNTFLLGKWYVGIVADEALSAAALISLHSCSRSCGSKGTSAKGAGGGSTAEPSIMSTQSNMFNWFKLRSRLLYQQTIIIAHDLAYDLPRCFEPICHWISYFDQAYCMESYCMTRTLSCVIELWKDAA